MSMYENLKRANAWHISAFLQKGVEALEDDIPNIDTEKAYDIAEKKMHDFMKKVLKGDNSDEFHEFSDIAHEYEQSCFVLGMRAGIKIAISFDLGK